MYENPLIEGLRKAGYCWEMDVVDGKWYAYAPDGDEPLALGHFLSRNKAIGACLRHIQDQHVSRYIENLGRRLIEALQREQILFHNPQKPFFLTKEYYQKSQDVVRAIEDLLREKPDEIPDNGEG